jgi:hypothetical protein
LTLRFCIGFMNRGLQRLESIIRPLTPVRSDLRVIQSEVKAPLVGPWTSGPSRDGHLPFRRRLWRRAARDDQVREQIDRGIDRQQIGQINGVFPRPSRSLTGAPLSARNGTLCKSRAGSSSPSVRSPRRAQCGAVVSDGIGEQSCGSRSQFLRARLNGRHCKNGKEFATGLTGLLLCADAQCQCLPAAGKAIRPVLPHLDS